MASLIPYYDDGTCTIYHADCREVLPGLIADLILTDPPYGIHKADWDGEFPTDWLPAAAAAAPAGGIMPGVWNLVGLPREIGRWRYRWTLAGHLINGMTRGTLGYGNWIPCAVYTADDVTLFRRESDTARIVVGTDPMPQHPSPKPYRYMTWLVARLSGPGQVILDPFMGSGTTLRAAKDMGRRAIGIEIEERYCEVAARRLGQEVLAL